MGLVVVLMNSPPAVPGADVADPVDPEGRERVDATSLLSYALKLRRDMVDGGCVGGGIAMARDSLACMHECGRRVSEAGRWLTSGDRVS